MTQIKKVKRCCFAVAGLLLLAGCQQTPGMSPHQASERAAYSEWSCDGEPMLAQFYGARVVISDSDSSQWLDRGTQVGQVFTNAHHRVRFADEQVEWQHPEGTVVCTPRALPEEWQQARRSSRQSLHFMATGTADSAQQQWQFLLRGERVRIVLSEVGRAVEERDFAAGDADYYLDMWTYNIQTSDDRMRVQITDGLCRNQRDQIPYPSSVQINWNDQVLLGCGRWLAKGNYRP